MSALSDRNFEASLHLKRKPTTTSLVTAQVRAIPQTNPIQIKMFPALLSIGAFLFLLYHNTPQNPLQLLQNLFLSY